MNTLAVVATAYKINDDIIERFLKYNSHIENLFLVTDSKIIGDYNRIQCPNQEIFSIAKTANLGIRQAVDAGFDVVLKTDIDCIITQGVLNYCQELPARMAACWRYYHLRDPDKLDESWQDTKCIGSAAMHAQAWEEVNGYNENMKGYGFDDGDLRFRARAKGITMPTLLKPHLYHIWHEEKHNRETINPLLRIENIAVRKKKYNNPEWGKFIDIE